MGALWKEWISAIRLRCAGQFDAVYYCRQYADLQGFWRFLLFPHYVLLGVRERRSPSESLCLPYYLDLYPEAAASEVNPLDHYRQLNREQISWPSYSQIRPLLYNLALQERLITASGLFDPDYYLRSHSGLRVHPANALDHYCRIGWRKKRNPHPLVSHVFLESLMPEKWAAHLNPLVYFIAIYPQGKRLVAWSKLCARYSGHLTLHALQISREVLDFSCSTPRLSVVMVVHNQVEWTAQALHSLCRERDPQTELILVDNASTDQTASLLHQIQGATLIHADKNLGFGDACNLGVEKAQGRNILFLNNDIRLLPGALRSAEQALESAPDVGAVGGRLIHFEGTLQEAGGVIFQDGSGQAYGRTASALQSEFEFQREVNYCSGAFLMVRKAVFKRLGGFDPVYSPAYFEDLDLCVRIRKDGWRILYEPRALIHHAEFGSSATPARAFELMESHRRIFKDRHAEWLPLCPRDRPINRRTRTASGKTPHVLMIDIELPVASRGRGLPRSQAITQSLVDLGADLTFFSLSYFPEDWATVYAAMPDGMEVVHDWGMGRLDIFMDLYHRDFDVLILSRPGTMDYIRNLKKINPAWFQGLKIIYDAEAIFAERSHMERQLKGEPDAECLFQAEQQQELSLAQEADAIWTVSRRDQQVYRNQGFHPVRVVGHVETVRPGQASFKDRCGFVFLGTIRPEKSLPNWDAVTWFLQTVWPSLRRALGPTVEVSLVGDATGVNLSSTGQQQGVHSLGVREDLEPVFNRHRVFIAPTRFSAGIPLKICTASALGLPTVASSHLAQHLEWLPEQDLLAPPTGDAEAFANACIRLHQDETLWQSLRQNALNRVNEEYSRERFNATIRQSLVDLVGAW